MSGGIARGRLSEERKAWRKNHPHVTLFLLFLFFIFSVVVRLLLVFCLSLIASSPLSFLVRFFFHSVVTLILSFHVSIFPSIEFHFLVVCSLISTSCFLEFSESLNLSVSFFDIWSFLEENEKKVEGETPRKPWSISPFPSAFLQLQLQQPSSLPMNHAHDLT